MKVSVKISKRNNYTVLNFKVICLRLAVANMILREDGNSNLECTDFLKKNPAQVQLKQAIVGLMNPPYSQGSKADPEQYELSFVKHMLDSLVEGARAAVIVPQSSMTGKSKVEQELKESIMKKHTLEGVITCNTDTFYGGWYKSSHSRIYCA